MNECYYILRFFKGKTPYSISKVGMTILANGLANEIKDTGTTHIDSSQLKVYTFFVEIQCSTIMDCYVPFVTFCIFV